MAHHKETFHYCTVLNSLFIVMQNVENNLLILIIDGVIGMSGRKINKYGLYGN